MKKASYFLLLFAVVFFTSCKKDNTSPASSSNVNGYIYTIAGNGIKGSSGDGGLSFIAELNEPTGIAVDASGNIYIADYNNNRIRKVTTKGIISTIAGNGIEGFAGDGGPSLSAELNNPWGIAVDGSGNIYIADQQNHRIRKVNIGGIISTFAGNGTAGYSGDGGPDTAAEINSPYGIAVDGSGNVYIADGGNNRIRKVNTSGIISTIAGNGTLGFSGDGGPATAAELWGPDAVVVDASGNIYIADNGNSRIRKVNTSGIISTIAGSGPYPYDYSFYGDGGPDTLAFLAGTTGVTIDASGNIYIADEFNRRIRKINTSGIISTFAGNGTVGNSGDSGPATAAELGDPMGIAVDGLGNLYIADFYNNNIRKVYK